MVEHTVGEVLSPRQVMIPTRDGTRLAANLFLPDPPEPSPAILTFYPYIKDLGLGKQFAPIHRHFARRGYAVLHADFRGTGCSEGVNPHPFDLTERRDGHDIVEWAAQQEWCSGRVGVWGISYGGITSLSIAATQPPHLAAIIPVNGTFDNYEWLFRTHGGRGLLLGDMDWGTRMAAMNLLPPLLDDHDGRYEELWEQRLAENRPWILDWHGSPPTDAFWSERRIPLDAIRVPTFGITGWYDAYTAPMLDVFAAVQAPTRVLIGPWKHTVPDMSPVEPVDSVHEMDRWWDRWLKGIDNGVDTEPPVTLFVTGARQWRYETEWPPARVVSERFYLHEEGVLDERRTGSAGEDRYEYDARVGAESIGYNGHRVYLPLPADQSADDRLSLCYTSAPLREAKEITGVARITLLMAATTDEATVVAKLCVVSPDGKSQVIAQGNGNPARPDAHAAKAPLTSPTERRQLTIAMHPTSVVVPAGARLRVALAGADFPELWPTSRRYMLIVHRGDVDGSWIELPMVPSRTEPLPSPELLPPRGELATMPEEAGVVRDTVHRHLGSRIVAFETRRSGTERVGKDTVLMSDHHACVTTDADRPWATNLRADSRFELRRPIAAVAIRVQSFVTAFTARVTADVSVDGMRYLQKCWIKDLRDGQHESESPPSRDARSDEAYGRSLTGPAGASGLDDA